MKRLLFAFVFIVYSVSARAELIAVDIVDSNTSTITKYYAGKKSKALIVFLPGGLGQFNFGSEKTDTTFHYSQTIKKLTDSNITSGRFDLVFLDSPYSLPVKCCQWYTPGVRGSDDHIKRIEGVINFYKKKTGLPIILMGHSNGTISQTEFYKYLQRNKKTDLINVLVFSGQRIESRIDDPINLPIIFIHHSKDQCNHTPYDGAKRHYNDLLKINKSHTFFISVDGGKGEEGDQCMGHNTYHMIFESGDEYAKKLDKELIISLKINKFDR
jgi:hypothetical protein